MVFVIKKQQNQKYLMAKAEIEMKSEENRRRSRFPFLGTRNRRVSVYGSPKRIAQDWVKTSVFVNNKEEQGKQITNPGSNSELTSLIQKKC